MPDENENLISESELRTLIGEEFDNRFKGVDEKLSALDGLDGKISELFTKHSSSSNGGEKVDRDGILKDVGALIDEKLSKFNPGKSERSPGPLGRLLKAR